ncbi:MAG TPA: AsmA family protein, partial [Gammaproteobacteria bacterium]|nr:AsmA family protein [Gammaproteobacteria bacterium]
MSKILKYTFYLVSLLVVLFVALVIAVSVLVDPNDYKAELTEKVQQATGRSLNIEGDLSLSFFPWFGIEIGKTELGNTPGFDGKVFAKIDQVSVNVQVLPLLREQLVIDQVILDGLSVKLMRNAQGKTNWDDMVSAVVPNKKPSRKKSSEKNFQKEMQEHHKGMGDLMKGLDIGGIKVSNASLEWDDRKNKVSWSLHDMNLNIGAVATDKPVSIKFSVLATDRRAGKDYPLSVSTVLTMNYEKHQMQLSDLELSLSELTLKGQVFMSGENLQMKGQLASNEFVPRDLLAGLGIKLPATQDDTVFGKASLATDFSMTTNKLSLDNLVLKLDDTSVRGNVKVAPLSPAGIHFELAVDELDADRYLPPVSKVAEKPAA